MLDPESGGVVVEETRLAPYECERACSDAPMRSGGGRRLFLYG